MGGAGSGVTSALSRYRRPPSCRGGCRRSTWSDWHCASRLDAEALEDVAIAESDVLAVEQLALLGVIVPCAR